MRLYLNQIVFFGERTQSNLKSYMSRLNIRGAEALLRLSWKSRRLDWLDTALYASHGRKAQRLGNFAVLWRRGANDKATSSQSSRRTPK